MLAGFGAVRTVVPSVTNTLVPVGEEHTRFVMADHQGILAIAVRRAVFILVAGSLCSARGSLGAQASDSRSSEITRLEHQWEDASRHNDTATFNRLMAPDYMSIRTDGVLGSREGRLRSLGSGAVRTAALELSEMRVRVNANTAVVTGLATRKDTTDGRLREFQYHYTRVWERQGGHWRVVVFQSTTVAPGQLGGLRTATADASATGAVATPTDSLARTLEQLDWQRFKAVQRADVRGLDTLLADDWLASGAAAHAVTKQEYLADVASGARWYGDIHHDDVHVRLYDNTAIITGRSVGPHRLDGRIVTDSGRFTHVYMRRGARWQMVGMHNSVIAAPAAAADMQAEVLAVDHRRQEALRRADSDALAQILGDEFTETGANGVRTKAMNVDDLHSGRVRWDHLAVSNEVVTVFNSTTAALTGVLDGDGTASGQPFTRHMRYLRIYVKRNGTWQNVAAANTPIAR